MVSSSPEGETAASLAAETPSPYKPEFAEQAARLCSRFLTDEEIAQVLGVSLADIAWWAWEHEEFFRAITPTHEQRMQWRAEMIACRAKANAHKRAAQQKRPGLRIENAMRARLWAALKGRTDGALFSRLPYSQQQLVDHLESRFLPGMTWENYGRWHVDHRKPCCLFDQADSAQFAECWSLDNLQPLWAEDNFRKGSRYASA